mgnify:CR=1 FL=1
MALFKILKGAASGLANKKITEGYCYVTTDEKKMYIDTSADTRICLNAANADTATKLKTARTISLGGAVTGSSSFDGSANITLNTAMNVNYAGSASKGGAASTVKDWGAAGSNSDRHVWFSYDGDDTKKVNSDKFKYNPATNKLTVGSITGSSASCTGNATTASKLASAKTISISGITTGSATFDGSANMTINTSFNKHTIDTYNKNNYPFKRIASVVVGTNIYSDCNMIIRVTEEFSSGLTGVCKIAIRTNSANADVQGTAEWIETNSKNIPKIYIGILGKTGENVVADIYYKCRSTYART